MEMKVGFLNFVNFSMRSNAVTVLEFENFELISISIDINTKCEKDNNLSTMNNCDLTIHFALYNVAGECYDKEKAMIISNFAFPKQ